MEGDLRIPLSRISDDGLDLDLEVEAAALGLEELDWPPLTGARLIGRLERTGPDEALFRGRLEGAFELECNLGLTRFDYRFSEEFEVYFISASLAKAGDAGDDVELAEKDLEVGYITDEEVDLLTPVRDQLGLAIPIQPKCLEKCLGENPEICRRLAAGEPVDPKGAEDPRWAALRGWNK